MACSGYFSKGRPELTMPRTHGHRDRSGVCWQGRVTNGEVSVEHAHFTSDQQARLAPQHLEHERRLGRRMEPLDPVLQPHIATK